MKGNMIMNREMMLESFDLFLDDTIGRYIGNFEEEHSNYNTSKEKYKSLFEKLEQALPTDCVQLAKDLRVVSEYNLDCLGAYMYTKGLHDGLIILGYLNSEYMGKKMSSQELTMYNMIYNSDEDKEE